MTTISARVVADGVGLPTFWQAETGHFHGEAVWLGCPQTAFGVALRLDQWEADHGPDGGWAPVVAQLIWEGDEDALLKFLREMAARLTQIGQDHSIRRMLGWAYEFGACATLTDCGGGAWKFAVTLEDGSYTEHWFAGDVDEANDHGILVDTSVPALAGITDPIEASAALYGGRSQDGWK